MTQEKADAAKALCGSASPGPWEARKGLDGWWRVKGEHVVALDMLEGDARFTASAHTDLPAALADRDALIDATIGLIDGWRAEYVSFFGEDSVPMLMDSPAMKRAATLLRLMEVEL